MRSRRRRSLFLFAALVLSASSAAAQVDRAALSGTIGGQRALEVRWEVFNVFNATQLGLPETNISSNARGTITRLAGDPRVMQFALRLVF